MADELAPHLKTHDAQVRRSFAIEKPVELSEGLAVC
jgi:hypothetical protein